MAQVAVNLVPHEYLSSSKSKRDPFPSYGRGGSGNIRRSHISGKSEQSGDPSVTLVPESQGTYTADEMRPAAQPARSELPTGHHSLEQTHFISSGRGGSGNIQPSASGLEAYPLTASILSQHNALQAQYEQWVRKLHADSNVVRSSGRGGSGNIRRRSHSQVPGTAPKKGFFTIKGREKNTGCLAEAHDRQDGNVDRRGIQCPGSPPQSRQPSQQRNDVKQFCDIRP
ncbi:hypothetical protein HD554DRAFT_2042698 [Boletus coccyginus]|nr:hypothetical protein HD554DRAFT_2042698 [Boletus coccyginus]